LTDVNEIKVLGFMLLLRLGQLAPTAVMPRLDEVVGSLGETMKGIEVKEDTAEWFSGVYCGKLGLFPSSHVRKL